MEYKADIKIYGIEERKDNILKNKEILGLKDTDVFILKKEDRTTPQDKFPYKMCKKMLLSPVEEGVTHRLVLQDDVELSPNFKEYLNKIINTHPNDIVQLLALDFRTKNEVGDSLNTPYIEVGQFICGCAMLFPVKYLEDMFNWIEGKYPEIYLCNPHEDIAFKFYSIQKRIRYITTVPSIVQHIGDISTCCDYKQPQRTAYFGDWEKANWDSTDTHRPYINYKEFMEWVEKEQELKLKGEIR